MNGLKQLIVKEKTETMASIVNDIWASVPARSVAEKIEEEGCKARVTLNKNDYIIVNLDDDELNGSYGSSKRKGDKRADFLFANDATGNKTPWNESHVAVLELKGGESKLTLNNFISQIQAGAELVEKFVPIKFAKTFRPVLVYTENKTEDRISTRDHRRLKKRLIKFHDKQKSITTLKSGENISKVFS